MTIGEFFVITGISAYTLRYYEKKGLLRDIKHYSDLRYQGDDTIAERMELLIQHRKSVVEEKRKWDKYLRNLDEKIGIYQAMISESEKD